MTPFAGVIFDCDGVLVDSEVISLDVELSSLAEIGLDYGREEFVARFMGLSGDSLFAALEADSGRRLGRALPAGLRQTMHARYQALLDEQLAAIPGVHAAVEAVTLPKAVASSSGTVGLAAKLEAVGLWSAFAPHIYSADQVTHGKPAPDLFLHAAAQLGISPERCLVIEDSANGVTGAKAAGMTVWGFLGGGHIGDNCGARLEAAGASRLLGDWDEAAAVLAALALP